MSAVLQSESLMDVYNPALELVKSLTTHSERQRLCGHIDGDIISARLPAATAIQFQVHREPSGLRTWNFFTVCDAQDRVLLRVTPDAPSPCNSAIDVLLLAISHQEAPWPTEWLPSAQHYQGKELAR
jgi:hypothetical protein